MTLQVLPYGDRAVLLEPDDPRDVLVLAAQLHGAPGVTEVVPGARTLLVRADTAARLVVLRAHVGRLGSAGGAPAGAGTGGAAGGGMGGAGGVPADPVGSVTLDVRYDGPDLAATAELLGLDPDGLVRAHTAAGYTVGFCGFAPGFAYLTGLDPALHAPRLAEPRTRVPAGAVGIAGEFTGVYPRASPGGWRLLGTTATVVWDVERDPPALLTPGTGVRFRAR